VPISAIRFRHGSYWTRLNELHFYGKPLPGAFEDITASGKLLSSPGSETSTGALTNGVLEDDGSGYHTGAGSTHRIVLNFDSIPKNASYVAINPNTYWKPTWNAIGFPTGTIPANLGTATTYSSTVDDGGAYSGMNGDGMPGHAWVILPINSGNSTSLYAAGVQINNFWGDLSEVVVINTVQRAVSF